MQSHYMNKTNKFNVATIIILMNNVVVSANPVQAPHGIELGGSDKYVGPSEDSSQLQILSNNGGLALTAKDSAIFKIGTTTAAGNFIIFHPQNANNATLEFIASPSGPSQLLLNGRSLTTLGTSAHPHSFLTGSGSSASGNYAFVAGLDNTAAYGGVALGEGSTASGPRSVAIGLNNTSGGPHSIAMGYGNSTSNIARYSTALGYFNTATGESSLALGNQSTASGRGSLAAGELSEAASIYSIALGCRAKALDNSAVAIGYESEARNVHSKALGQNLITDSRSNLAVGKFNENLRRDGTPPSLFDNDLDPILEVGIGANNANRRNALTVFKDGEVVIKHKSYTPTNESPVVLNLLGSGSVNGNLNVSGEVNISGNVNINGNLLLPPAGDLEMGEFQ